MTRNQLQFHANREIARSNLAREAEQHRSNLANEQETRRSNLARETETSRSNLAREAETNRANLRNEEAAMITAKAKEMSGKAKKLTSVANAAATMLKSPLEAFKLGQQTGLAIDPPDFDKEIGGGVIGQLLGSII